MAFPLLKTPTCRVVMGLCAHFYGKYRAWRLMVQAIRRFFYKNESKWRVYAAYECMQVRFLGHIGSF